MWYYFHFNKEKLMNMQTGTKLVCVVNPLESKTLSVNKEYVFKKYIDTSIPVNNYSATMTWYPDKPIWTPEEYEEIRFNFMLVEVEGYDKPFPLKYFDFKK